jgi:hypothetical protein
MERLKNARAALARFQRLDVGDERPQLIVGAGLIGSRAGAGKKQS